jgi:hypothetical protein
MKGDGFHIQTSYSHIEEWCGKVYRDGETSIPSNLPHNFFCLAFDKVKRWGSRDEYEEKGEEVVAICHIHPTFPGGEVSERRFEFVGGPSFDDPSQAADHIIEEAAKLAPAAIAGKAALRKLKWWF